ncbi:OmpL47-type beta-barrel domain-containing protein [Marinilabilia salmonicolor]|uniref:Ig-like domain-containing protein n=1 Tax=Marinilabilia salmonicolor TaxID=989 RepID=A0A368UVI8_9BACT|nr:hypothetical protein [Marinilabilia salmonicolor]RCW32683.1 hypothetical protein DFO77_1149 [Marinilabilia salmonicolor]
MNTELRIGPFKKTSFCTRRLTGTALLTTLMLTSAGNFSSSAQEPLQHEKRFYQSEDGKLFVNKDLPLYLRISSDPDDEAESWLLKSNTTAQYSNPMYLDTEGWNTLRSPSAVDTATRKTVYPLQDIIFDIYADGLQPKSRLLWGESVNVRTDDKVFFGEKVHLAFDASDEMSGVADVYYSLNGSGFVGEKQSPLSVDEEGDYSLKFYSVDNVGNVEDMHSFDFSVDHTAPISTHEISGINKNNVLAPDATICLSAVDSLSGVNNVFFAIDDGEFEEYKNPIPVSRLKEGDGQITYYAEDRVGNAEAHKYIGTLSSGASKAEGEGEVFDYYIDRDAPVVSFEFEGDYFEGDREYISGRTTVALSAKDDKSGVQSILYSYNSFLTNEVYDNSFHPEGNSPVVLSYSAVDWVENSAPETDRHFYIDRTAPGSKVSFDGPVFRNRDTLFLAAQTRISLDAKDQESGVKSISYSLNGVEKEYGESFSGDRSGENLLEWRSTDNVNNQEELQSLVFVVDREGPSIHHHFSVEPIGEKTIREENYVIYPSNTKIYIGATDDVAGEESLKYSVNGSKVSEKIPLSGLQPGNYTIDIEAADALENKTTKTIRFSIEK